MNTQVEVKLLTEGVNFRELGIKYNVPPTGNTGKFTSIDVTNIYKKMNEDDFRTFCLTIADTYLTSKIGVGWDDLPDVNNLFEYADQRKSRNFETLLKGLKKACDKRVRKGFYESAPSTAKPPVNESKVQKTKRLVDSFRNYMKSADNSK